jgi:hypothetical protein
MACTVAGLFFLAAIFFFGVMGGLEESQKAIDENKKKIAAYMETHHCVRTGFIGKKDIPLVKCDTGVWKLPELEEKIVE